MAEKSLFVNIDAKDNLYVGNGASAPTYSARLTVRGSSDLIGTTSLLVTNNSGSQSLKITDDGITETNTIKLTNGSRLRSLNGNNSYLDFRNGADDIAILEATDGLRLRSGPSGGYEGIYCDSLGRVIAGGTVPLNSISGFSSLHSSSFGNDIYHRSGFYYIYGGQTTPRGWMFIDAANSRYKLGSGNSVGVQVVIGLNNDNHTDFYNQTAGLLYSTHGVTQNIGGDASQAAGNSSLGSTTMWTPSQNNGVDIDKKSASIRTYYHDVPGRRITSTFDVDGNDIYHANDDGEMTIEKLTCRSYTVASAPAVWENGVIIITNEVGSGGGLTFAIGNIITGTWQRVSDGADIS